MENDKNNVENKSADLFRDQALSGRRPEGHSDVLRMTPAWSRWTFGVLLAGAVAAAVFLCLGTYGDHAAGPAVVRTPQSTPIFARATGTVVTVEVEPGQQVARGQVLVKLYAGAEQAEYRRACRELERRLLLSLADPADASASQALVGLREKRDLARARLDERLLRAPHAGVVINLRARPGQHQEAGALLLSLSSRRDPLEVVALLPGHFRPQLHVGMELSWRPTGYQEIIQTARLRSVGDTIIGPGEARRYLGQVIGDAVTIEGPVVLVRATLPAGGFSLSRATDASSARGRAGVGALGPYPA